MNFELCEAIGLNVHPVRYRTKKNEIFPLNGIYTLVIYTLDIFTLSIYTLSIYTLSIFTLTNRSYITILYLQELPNLCSECMVAFGTYFSKRQGQASQGPPVLEVCQSPIVLYHRQTCRLQRETRSLPCNC